MAAGVLTHDATEFTSMVADRAPAMLDVALRCRDLIRTLMPGVVEVVWFEQGTAGYGTGPRKMSDQFAWIAPASAHITLGFYAGAELADRAGLLEGTGARMRHVKVRSPDDAARADLAELIRAAIAHHGG